MEGMPQGVPEKQNSARAEVRRADADMTIGLHQETEAQKAAAEVADRIALWGVRLNLVRGEIATAEQQNKPKEFIDGLKQRETTLEQEMLAMSNKDESATN